MSQKTDDFLKKVAPIVQQVYKERKAKGKWVLPSVCLAQAALETGWGSSGLMMKANALFGIKAGQSWKGKVYNAKTKECYDGVNYTTITDSFRAYDDIVESINDYYDLITTSARYSLAVNNPDPLSAITAIKNGGYATSPNYIPNVYNIVKGYNLTQYDNVTTGTAPVAPTTSGQVSDAVIRYLAEGVIAKKFGDGDVRKANLGPLYDRVQMMVNQILKGGK